MEVNRLVMLLHNDCKSFLLLPQKLSVEIIVAQDCLSSKEANVNTLAVALSFNFVFTFLECTFLRGVS